MTCYKLGLLGYPIDHCLSPKMQNHWLWQLGCAGSYDRLATDGSAQGFSDRVKNIVDQGYIGANVTLPHKQTAFEVCDSLSEEAKAIGAVNTLLFKDKNNIYGHNTDIYGFMCNLKDHTDYLKSQSTQQAIILGAGGAMRSVLYGLLKQGFIHIFIVNRTVKNAIDIVAQFQPMFPKVHFQVGDWGKLPEYLNMLSEGGLVVNTSSVGMHGSGVKLPDIRFHKRYLVSDIIYTPLITPLLTLAKQQGCAVQDGFGMLLHQGAAAFLEWTGHLPVVDQNLRDYLLNNR